MFGIYDGLIVILVEVVGFEVFYLFGVVVVYIKLGWFDIGLISVIEMVEMMVLVVDWIDLLVIIDVDIGFGNVLNV